MIKMTELKNIKLLILDVDGVLTDGRIEYGSGGMEIKAFDVKDGFGIRLLLEAGIEVAIITGRKSDALRHRVKDLKIEHLYEGVEDKVDVFKELLEKLGVDEEKVAYVGDDLYDLPVMTKVGVSIAVHDAHEAVKESADLVTTLPGGRGAVREVCEAMLEAKGLMQEIVERYLYVDGA